MAETPPPKWRGWRTEGLVPPSGLLPYSIRRTGGSYGVLSHLALELGNSDTATPERGASMPARGTEDGGGIVAKHQPVMGWTGRRSARKATDLSRPGNRKAPRVLSSCSPTEWGFSCNGLCRAQERDRYRVENRSKERVRKAECVEMRPLGLERGKG